MNLKTIPIFLALVLISVVAYRWMTPRYGKVSENAYELATALYGACLAKSEDRIDRIEAKLDDDGFASSMSESENQWFRELIDQARNQQWNKAADSARLMMEEQVE